jgi:hypothetical protein
LEKARKRKIGEKASKKRREREREREREKENVWFLWNFMRTWHRSPIFPKAAQLQ